MALLDVFSARRTADRSADPTRRESGGVGDGATRPADPRHSVDPQALLAIHDLELRARTVLEGVRAGLHRSPFTGFSAEFTEYRQYSPGDDLRYLDWRVLARTDRHFLKKFEEETNLRCFLLVDASRSMRFASAGVTKADYARTLIATLAWFLHQQRDVVGTALFDEHVHDVVPPRWRAGHLRHVFATLSREPVGRDTNLAVALQETARLCRRRSLIVIVSDFLTSATNWSPALNELTAAGHDVRALQVLDPAEVTLDKFGNAAVWEDLETGQTRYIDPSQARAGYRQRFDAHAATLGNRDVVRHLGGEPFDREDSLRRLTMAVGQWPLQGMGYWAVERKSDQRLVGQVGFADFQRNMKPDIAGLPEMGWIFDTVAHGQGIAGEAARAALAWIDETYAPPEITAIISIENAKSMRLAERLGFVREPDAVYRDELIALFRRTHRD